VRGYHNTTIIAGVYSMISLIFGWWGIPWASIYTVQVIVNNSKEGMSFAVRLILFSQDVQIYVKSTIYVIIICKGRTLS